MSRTHHRRYSRSTTSLRTYFLIAVACGLLALLVQVLFEAPAKIEEYAGSRIEGAVRQAVKAEVQEATKQQVRP